MKRLLLLLGLIVVPLVPQYGPGANRHINDCGLAAAAMVIQAYTGEAVTVDRLWQETGVIADRPLHIYREIQPLLAQHGVDTILAWDISPSFMASYYPDRPIIVLMDWYGGHYIVVVGLDASLVWYYDPLLSHGPVSMPLAEFERQWTPALIPRERLP